MPQLTNLNPRRHPEIPWKILDREKVARENTMSALAGVPDEGVILYNSDPLVFDGWRLGYHKDHGMFIRRCDSRRVMPRPTYFIGKPKTMGQFIQCIAELSRKGDDELLAAAIRIFDTLYPPSKPEYFLGPDDAHTEFICRNFPEPA